MDNQCEVTCPDEHYFVVEDDLTCLACDNSCLTCEGAASNECLSCSTGLYLLENECLIECGSGYYT